VLAGPLGGLLCGISEGFENLALLRSGFASDTSPPIRVGTAPVDSREAGST